MTLQDLPVAPAGYEWRVTEHPERQCTSALLFHDGNMLGGVQHPHMTPAGFYGTATSTDVHRCANPYEAALHLFYHLGLVTLGEVDDALQGKVAA
jgi:hypothetical protein